MGLVARVAEVNLPPESMRVGLHYWAINSTLAAGYILVVSDWLPMCHVTGGGDTDLQPAVVALLSGADFAGGWQRTTDNTKAGMTSTLFRNRKVQAFTIVISRASKPGQRLDRVRCWRRPPSKGRVPPQPPRELSAQIAVAS